MSPGYCGCCIPSWSPFYYLLLSFSFYTCHRLCCLYTSSVWNLKLRMIMISGMVQEKPLVHFGGHKQEHGMVKWFYSHSDYLVITLCICQRKILLYLATLWNYYEMDVDKIYVLELVHLRLWSGGPSSHPRVRACINYLLPWCPPCGHLLCSYNCFSRKRETNSLGWW